MSALAETDDEERFYVSDYDGVAIDDTTDAVRLERQADAYARARHLRRMPSDARLARQVQRRMRRFFLPMNLELTPDPNRRRAQPFAPIVQGPIAVSATDHLFAAWCHHLVAQAPEDDEVSYQWIGETFLELVVVACQHTAASRVYWPSSEAWRALRLRVAHVIVRYFDHGAVHRRKLLDLMTSTEFVFHATASPALTALFEERKWPASVRRQRDEEVEADKRRVAEGEESQLKEVAVEMQGYLWRCATPEQLIVQYHHIAARTVFVVDLQNRLVERYGVDMLPPLEFNPDVLTNAYEWTKAKCRIELTEQDTKLFRDTANRWWAPLGAETHASRDATTRDDPPAPLQILEGELGITISKNYHMRSLLPPPKQADLHPTNADADDTSLFWEALFLTLFHNECMRTLDLNFIERYVYECGHARTTVKRMLVKSHKGKMPKRPFLVRLQRHWHLFHRGKLRRTCHGLLGAILAWLYILHTEHADRTENHNEDTRALREAFLQSIATCLRP